MITDLKDIGFYTLSNNRVQHSSMSSPLWRAELILTGRCNFKCPYCRQVGGTDMPLEQAMSIVNLWCDQGLKNVRFSGGEPTMYKGLLDLVKLCKERGVERIAISTNGASSMELYYDLLDAGVNDFSISLDACCAEDGDRMAGGHVRGAFDRVVNSITQLSKKTYVTVGVVLTADNKDEAEKIIAFADTLGVADIRVIPAAQEGTQLPALNVPAEILAKYPILCYRTANLASNIPVRGLNERSVGSCGLVLDDMAVMGGKHYPCIIYLREEGEPIGDVGPNMRQERLEWYKTHDCFADSICKKNCLDVCVSYNIAFAALNPIRNNGI